MDAQSVDLNNNTERVSEKNTREKSDAFAELHTTAAIENIQMNSDKESPQRSVGDPEFPHQLRQRRNGPVHTSEAIDRQTSEIVSQNWSVKRDLVKSHIDSRSDCIETQLGQVSQQVSKMARSILVNVFMAAFISVVQLYTWFTLPIYFVSQKPWQRRSKTERNRVKQIVPPLMLNPNNMISDEEEEEKMMSVTYVRNDSVKKEHDIIKLDTVTEMLDRIVQVHGANTQALGYRQVLSEEESLDDQGKSRRIDGRQLKRYRLSEYKWLTYGQVDTFTRSLAQALFTKGVASSDKVLIISETRVEWMICAQAIIRTGATIVTLFSNLGVDGVAHGIMETQVSTVIASIDSLPLVEKVLKRDGHSVRRVIYIDGYKKPDLAGFDDSIETVALSELEQMGKRALKEGTVRPLFRATPDHLMIIMYTSGTTGTPKAALMTHRQFTSSVQSLYILVQDVIQEAPYNSYISYLPMAHVLELTVESFFFLGGVKIGYASPFTLTDSAPGLAPGQKCDIKLLRPTVITAVPLVLDRILKEVNEKLRSRTPVSESVFKFLMDYKSRWTRRGYKCNIVRKLLCKKVQEQLGGNLAYMIVGGAPLNARTQATIKSALDITLIQGYGATETTGAALAMDFDDLEYGCVGAPLGGVKLRLKDWPEGGYYSKDKPYPRGEILIGGNSIAMGYYKLPRQTEEAFFIDRQGTRWFRTGDIGQIYPNGTMKIIDRRKDLIKLQNGEYISLGKVESALKACQYVDNICVYGGAFSSDLVALISPNKKALDELVLKLGKEHLSTFRNKCDDNEIEQEIYEEIVKVAKTASLGKKEIPVRIKVVPDEWSPDNGILTAALKLKRKTIETNYQKEIDRLYEKRGDKVVSSKQFDQNNNDIVKPASATNGTSKLTSESSNDHVANSNGKHTQITIQSV